MVRIVMENENTIMEQLLPKKSKQTYKKIYQKFSSWKIEKGAMEVTEALVLNYIVEHSKSLKPSSLWSYCSMLKACLIIFENVDIGKFSKVKALLKQNSKGFRSKKSKVLNRDDMLRFFSEAPDEIFLLVKRIEIYALIAAFITLIDIGNAQLLDDDLLEEYPTLATEEIDLEFQNLPVEDEGYDFIIIGSGSAGAVIANRLSEVANWNILLIEAGYLENSLTEYPSLAGLLQLTDYNWGYSTEPEKKACRAMIEKRCAFPRGKALGGSTVINYMIYSRGHPEDYNRWAAQGNPGWSYEEVLPYFLKSEDSHLNHSNEAYHHKGGYLSVSDAFASELADVFIQAGQQLGYKEVDYNSHEEIGFSKIQANMKQGRRHSVAAAFLRPILRRKNLTVLTDSTVLKILIDPFTSRAYGVEYVRSNKKYIARSTKEVILSAGVINSPQLLMLSGIGPKVYLKELGIVTLSDLPVGQTLYDHISFPGLVIFTNLTNDSPPPFSPFELLQWYGTGKGPISSTGSLEGLAFVSTDASEDKNYPDVELLLQMGSLKMNNGTLSRRLLRLSDDYYNQMYLPLPSTPTFNIVLVVLHPKSRGYLTLNATNPYGPPLIHANYFTDKENSDLKTLTASIRFIQKLLQTEAFQKIGAKLIDKPYVGCEHLPYDSDEYWHCAISYVTVAAYHPTSTCKMGPVDDPYAIVNPELKVYGIGNLRVADSSVIPFSLSAHTNAPTIMVGEVASDIIKREWGAL